MIDVQLLRTDPEAVKRSQLLRGEPVDIVNDAVVADTDHRHALTRAETLRAAQNELNQRIRTATPAARPDLIEEGRALRAKVDAAESTLTVAAARFNYLHRQIPNIVEAGVPAGGEDDYVVLREVGQRPAFDFEVLDHLTLATKLDAIDMDRGAKVAGARFYFMKGVGYQLQDAIMRLAMDAALDAGFIPMATPTLVKPEIMAGTGFLGKHADEIYHLEADDLYLTGTSEVALAGYHADEILDLTQPLRYVGNSTCYRREAGAHGKDTRGIIRVHQFEKLEMFTYITPADAATEHARLLAMQEHMLQLLELPYRVIDTAAGDLGTSAARKYDVEAWVPTQGRYRELTSTSNCTTFQARRLNIRHKVEGKNTPVATLNGTLATTRWLVALLEVHQTVDGNVRIPAALQPYMRGKTHLG